MKFIVFSMCMHFILFFLLFTRISESKGRYNMVIILERKLQKTLKTRLLYIFCYITIFVSVSARLALRKL